jgi:hypothetical protein
MKYPSKSATRLLRTDIPKLLTGRLGWYSGKVCARWSAYSPLPQHVSTTQVGITALPYWFTTKYYRFIKQERYTIDVLRSVFSLSYRTLILEGDNHNSQKILSALPDVFHNSINDKLARVLQDGLQQVHHQSLISAKRSEDSPPPALSATQNYDR